MTPNRQKRSDITAGLVCTGLMAVATAYFGYGAAALASGSGPELSGSLWSPPMVFTLAFPAVAAYLAWMIAHRYLDAPPLNAVMVALPLSFVVGFITFRAVWDTSMWASVAVTSVVLLLLCAAVVAVEAAVGRERPASS